MKVLLCFPQAYPHFQVAALVVCPVKVHQVWPQVQADQNHLQVWSAQSSPVFRPMIHPAIIQAFHQHHLAHILQAPQWAFLHLVMFTLLVIALHCFLQVVLSPARSQAFQVYHQVQHYHLLEHTHYQV